MPPSTLDEISPEQQERNETHPQVSHAIDTTREDVAGPEVIRNQGAGMAYLAVSQATAMTVMDANDYLRAIGKISAAAVSVMTAQMIEDKDAEPWSRMISDVTNNMTKTADLFATIGTNAGKILRAFESQMAGTAESGTP